MIIAGTVSAYLKLSIDDFKNNLLAAMQLLGQLGTAGQQSAAGITAVENAAGGAAAAISGQFGTAVSALSTGAGIVSQSAASIAASMTVMSGSAAAAGGAISASMTAAGTSAEQMSSGVSSAFSGAVMSVTVSGIALSGAASSTAAAVSGALGTAASAAADAGAGISASMASTATATSSSMAAAVASIGTLSAAQAPALANANAISRNIQTPIKNLVGPLKAAMVAAGNGMISGLQSRAAAIAATAKSMADRVRATIEDALEIASPSKVMRRIGGYTVEGLALGMEDLLPRVERSASLVARTVEQSSSAVVAPPVAGSPEMPRMNAPRPYAQDMTEEGRDIGTLIDSIEHLVGWLSSSEPVLRLDGRAFGRMVREYSQ